MLANPAIRQLDGTTAARFARNLHPTPQRRDQGRPLAVHLAVQAEAALPALWVGQIDSGAAASFRGRELGSRRARQKAAREEASRRRRTCRACGESGRGSSASGARRRRGCPGRLSGASSRFARARCGWLRRLRG